MKHISDLFARYKNIIKPPQASVIKEFIEVCKEVSGLDIKNEQCSYVLSTKTIYLQTPSLIKSELMQKKSQILIEMGKRMGKNTPTQII